MLGAFKGKLGRFREWFPGIRDYYPHFVYKGNGGSVLSHLEIYVFLWFEGHFDLLRFSTGQRIKLELSRNHFLEG